MVRFSTTQPGRLIRRARLDAGLPQSELASRAGISQPSLAQMKKGTRTPSDEMLERVLRAADYRVAYVACILVIAPASLLLIVPVSTWGGFGRWLLALVVCPTRRPLFPANAH